MISYYLNVQFQGQRVNAVNILLFYKTLQIPMYERHNKMLCVHNAGVENVKQHNNDTLLYLLILLLLSIGSSDSVRRR